MPEDIVLATNMLCVIAAFPHSPMHHPTFPPCHEASNETSGVPEALGMERDPSIGIACVPYPNGPTWVVNITFSR
jgi:hypothetical protein